MARRRVRASPVGCGFRSLQSYDVGSFQLAPSGFPRVHNYRVFGVGVQCAFELPELKPSILRHSGGWRVESHWETPPAEGLEPTGTDVVYGSVRVRSSVSQDLARLAFDDTGTFDVVPSARLIRWHRGADSNVAAVRADLLGRVLAMAVHHEGALVLHASAVSIDDAVVAFLGPKQAGKSTLAMALVGRGARLVTDDTLAVRFQGDQAVVDPGVQRVRLWPDSARAVGAAATSRDGAKPTIDDLAPDSCEDMARPLVACYVLHSVPGGQGFVRRQLGNVHAAITGVTSSKLGALAGGRLAVEVLDRSTRLARLVPVYAANVPRDLSVLSRVASAVMRWHGTSAPNVTAGQ